MSTTDIRPEAVSCGGEPVPDGPTLELLPGRRVPLSPRESDPQTVVTRLLPQRERRTVGAWCFVDHYGPDDLGGTDGMQVAPHPHTGLQTASWLLDGLVRHRDSLGSDVLLRPGALGLMTAGRGIAHSERSPADRPDLLHGVQLWVALPEAARRGEPQFALHDDDLPTVQGSGWSARVFVGSLAGASSPAVTHTPLLGAELRLAAGAATTLALAGSFEHAVVVVAGELLVDGARIAPGTLAYLGTGREALQASSPDGAVALLLGGEPFAEELVMWWNFIGRSQEEIERFRRDWNGSDTAGSDTAGAGPFGRVVGDDDARMLAPPLPGVALNPRGRTG
jgi:redox-sensitive bicupin YhaK (pirin superfamily)